MKKVTLLLLVSGFSVICKSQNIEALKKDPDIIALKKATEQLKSHHYKMPANYIALQGEMMKNPSATNMKMVLKKNGMVDADEFVDVIMAQRNAMLHFSQKHPEFKTMDATKRLEIMKAVLTN